jgi:hypothetical protein
MSRRPSCIVRAAGPCAYCGEHCYQLHYAGERLTCEQCCETCSPITDDEVSAALERDDT